MVKKPPAMQETQETQVQSLGQEHSLEEGMATHSSILAWKKDPINIRAWQTPVYGAAEGWTRLSMHKVLLADSMSAS